METKEYLNQARLLNEQIQSNLQQIEAFEALVRSYPQIALATETPIRGNDNSDSKAFAEETTGIIISLQNRIRKLLEVKKEIMEVICRVEIPEYRILLEKRYLCNFSWKQIAEDLHYSDAQVYRIHAKALAAVTRILENDERE